MSQMSAVLQIRNHTLFQERGFLFVVNLMRQSSNFLISDLTKVEEFMKGNFIE